jgi:hypothetical protein
MACVIRAHCRLGSEGGVAWCRSPRPHRNGDYRNGRRLAWRADWAVARLEKGRTICRIPDVGNGCRRAIGHPAVCGLAELRRRSFRFLSYGGMVEHAWRSNGIGVALGDQPIRHGRDAGITPALGSGSPPGRTGRSGQLVGDWAGRGLGRDGVHRRQDSSCR